MLARIYRVTLFVLLALQTQQCNPTPSGGTAPKPPSIGPVSVNAVMWRDEPLTVYFTNHAVFRETQATTGMNDLYFANVYSFQVQLKYQLLATGFEIQEKGVPIPLLSARTNSQTRPIVDSQGNVTGYDWPLPTYMAPRGVPPTDKSSYSIEAINTCAGKVDPSGKPCPSPEPILLLTISLPTLPANPIHGQTFEYTLVEKGTGSASGTSAKTDIKAIYIEPQRCRVNSVLLQPSIGKAGDIATATFEATSCKRVTVTAGSITLFDRITPAYADDVRDSRGFALPKDLSIEVTVKAFDAVQRQAVPSRGTVQIEPCSISPTHPQCPVNCTTNPADPRCPANCSTSPSDPRCKTACPRTTDNPNGEYKSWDTGMYCGTFQVIPQTIYGCTFAEAKQNFPPAYGCVYTTITGAPVGECPNGVPKNDYDMCLSCKAPGASTATSEYVVIRSACSLNEAKETAISSRVPSTCVFVKPGMC